MIPADIRRGAMCELARRDFFFYCKLKAPDFYTDDRKFLVDFCNQLQEFFFPTSGFSSLICRRVTESRGR